MGSADSSVCIMLLKKHRCSAGMRPAAMVMPGQVRHASTAEARHCFSIRLSFHTDLRVLPLPCCRRHLG